MKKILYLSFMLLFSSCIMSQKNTPPSQQKNIVIVGAGIAGLSAANYLKEKGFNPIILEAQAKVGGRLKTNRSLGFPFDEGASWIHGPNGNPITKLAKQSNTKTFLTSDESIKVYAVDGSEYTSTQLEQAENQYNEILEELKGKKNQSFGTVFYQKYPQYKANPLWTYMLSAYLEFDTGGDIYQLSSKDFYDDKAFRGEDVIITNGYDNIANYLAKGLDIRLNTTVTSIDYSNNKVSIGTNNGNYVADQILVTVPLGVLKKGAIKFTPPLPDPTQEAIHKLQLGAVNKFLLVWDKAFWEENVQYIGYTPTEKGKFNYFLNMKKIANTNALMTFAFGEYSKQTEQMTDQAIIAAIMEHLKNIYGPDIPQPSQFLRTKWNENPYSYGAYSFATNGTSSALFEMFEKAINNQVFFAGEHTIHDYRGTVHGAYLSGIRAAKKIAVRR
ncbi:MAG: flavin monoamine oxidase family protein [Aureispira sp.]